MIWVGDLQKYAPVVRCLDSCLAFTLRSDLEGAAVMLR